MEFDTDLVTCDDGLARPKWAATDPMLRVYYDTEWGMPVADEQGIYERICLEGFQAGLSWATILRKRAAFREAFDNFDPEKVATYNTKQIQHLCNNAAIVRNHRKIKSAVNNAHATLRLRQQGGLAAFVWSFRPHKTPKPQYMHDIPTQSVESTALSKALKREGFSFVGPTTMFALMESIGMVDTHLVGSHRRGSSGIW